jgi:hypothetical protein
MGMGIYETRATRSRKLLVDVVRKGKMVKMKRERRKEVMAKRMVMKKATTRMARRRK